MSKRRREEDPFAELRELCRVWAEEPGQPEKLEPEEPAPSDMLQPKLELQEEVEPITVGPGSAMTPWDDPRSTASSSVGGGRAKLTGR